MLVILRTLLRILCEPIDTTVSSSLYYQLLILAIGSIGGFLLFRRSLQLTERLTHLQVGQCYGLEGMSLYCVVVTYVTEYQLVQGIFSVYTTRHCDVTWMTLLRTRGVPGQLFLFCAQVKEFCLLYTKEKTRGSCFHISIQLNTCNFNCQAILVD